ncbi:hypothetical protein RB601_007695 [Gaeumannomyces tritici]
MDSREPLFVYKETRLNLEPSLSTTVHIHLKSSNGAGHSSRSNGRSSEDERAYRVKGLASASAVFYRQHHSSPRAFLWRILDGGRILSLQAADIHRQEKVVDAPLTVHVHFPSPLKPNCVAFADPKNLDALSIFAFDESNNLHSLLLKSDVFRKRSASEAVNPADTPKPFLPAALGFKHVHRLVAVNTDRLLATLHDGGLLVFDRTHGHDAVTPWKETFYNSSGWTQGLRNLLPFQSGPTVRYGKVNMDLTAATSVAVTSMGMQKTSFMFTVCLDHRMRIWNGSGAILFTGDILNSERNPQEVGKWTIDPSQSNLVRVLECAEGHCLCVTYSPIGTGAFKVWKVAASSPDSIIVKDMFPDHNLAPPAPSSSDIWTLADFGLTQDPLCANRLWVLWKNNLTYRVQKVDFKLDTIEAAWANEWVDVFADHTAPPAQSANPCDPTDATEKWLQIIFAPGRFTRSMLETALAMYEGGVGSAKTSSGSGKKSLVESICTVLGSTATLERDSAGEIDYGQFRATSEIHWRRFYRLLVELDKQRGEALSLAVDPVSGLTWVVCADCVSVVRACSKLERVYHNLSSPESNYQATSCLLTAGTSFLASFSDNMLQMCAAALRAELSEDSSKTDYERIQHFSEKSGFWRLVTDEDCAQVLESLGDGFKLVSFDLYRSLFSLVGETDNAQARDVRDPFTEFGRKLVVKGTRDTAELHWRILFSQVILLVHMENEQDNEEDAIHSRLDIGQVYRQLILALRRLELVRWLAKTELSVPLPKVDRSNGLQQLANTSPAPSHKSGDETHIISTLEASISHLLGLSEPSGEPMAAILTDVMTDICAPDSNMELSTARTQCLLLKRDRPDLAIELGAFAKQDPFSTYVQGRVALALRDYDVALVHFKKAAIGMSVPMKHADRHSMGLLDDTEWNLLNNGLPNYYAHIVSLYERQKAYSYVASFARLSLQFANGQDPASASTRAEMLSRLFVSATAISRFDLAHTALLSMTDAALQHSCLKRLVEKMCETQQNAELMNLPFCHLHDSVDRILEQKCQAAAAAAAAVDSTQAGRGVPWHQVLYAWRVHHNDFKGAAAALLDRTKKLKKLGEGDKLLGDDVLDTPVTRQYLMLINALSCVEPKDAWIVSEEEAGTHGKVATSGVDVYESIDLLAGAGTGEAADLRALAANLMPADVDRAWRRVLSLADLRRDYQGELDRIAAIQNNQFDFAVGDEAMDES